MTILWITDGEGWGHDQLAQAVARRLSGYTHRFIARRKVRIRDGFLLERLELFEQRILDIEWDLIVALHALAVPERFLHKSILRLGMKTSKTAVLS